MATNVQAGMVRERTARLYNANVSATTTTTVTTPAANARGKKIGQFFVRDVSGSSANYAIKVQDSDGPLWGGKAEANWEWRDLVSFAAIAVDTAVYEAVEPTKPVRRYLRAVITRTGGSITGLEVGYNFTQCGSRQSRGVFSPSVS